MRPFNIYRFLFRKDGVIHATEAPVIDQQHGARFAMEWCNLMNVEPVKAADLQPEALRAALMDNSFAAARVLPSGEVLGVLPMLFTTGLYVGVTVESPGRTRYCYENAHDAMSALQAWDGAGDPPGPWIKQKPEDRLGPGATEQT